jgi:hypothetical protein
VNLYSIIGGFIGAVALIVGSFLTGERFGRDHVTVKYQQSTLTAWKTSFDQAIQLGRDYAGIAQNYANKMAAHTQAVNTRNQKVEGVIHDRPLPNTAVLDPELVSLRCDAIQELYTAAGRELPGPCVHAGAAAENIPAK